MSNPRIWMMMKWLNLSLFHTVLLLILYIVNYICLYQIAFFKEGLAIELQVYYYALSFYLNDMKPFVHWLVCLIVINLCGMNTIDKTLQRQLPTNVLLLIVSSLCVVSAFWWVWTIALLMYSNLVYPYGCIVFCWSCVSFLQFGVFLCCLQLSLERSAYCMQCRLIYDYRWFQFTFSFLLSSIAILICLS